MKKLFLPPGSKVVGNQVTLASGDVVPKWVLIGVPTVRMRPRPPVTRGAGIIPTGEFVDMVTGAVTRNVPPRQASTSRAGEYDFSEFSRFIPRETYNRLVSDSLPRRPTKDPTLGIDPGYFEQMDAQPRPYVASFSTEVTDPTADTPIDATYKVRDALIWEGRPQELKPQGSATAANIVVNMRFVAATVLDLLDAENAYYPGYDVILPMRIRSWYVENAYWTPDAESHVGSAVRLEFDGTKEQVYKKAVDLATKLSFDRMYLDYRSDGRTLITVVAPIDEAKRRIGTRYDDILVSANRFICASGDENVDEDVPGSTVDSDDDVLPDPNDDYYPFYLAVMKNPQIFGGVEKAMNMLKTMGFPTNPMLSGKAGFSPTAGTAATTASKEAMSGVSDTIQCPETNRNAKVFSTSSHPGMRVINDVTQLDDKTTQDTIPFTVRSNNPLKVKVIKGVTDLKDRFGFLGEAEGVAVYKDHIGGAAAGLAYLMQMSGSTVGSAAKSLLGKGASSGDGSDITSTSLGKAMQGLGENMFGVSDPTGAIQECTTVKADDMDSMLTMAASMAMSLAEMDKSPLTYSEWASAYQIAKNEAKGDLKKSSTGFDLPVTERDDTKVQPTGSKTPEQGKDKPHSIDQEKAVAEKWNPIGNFAHYSQNVWGDQGSRWISRNLVTYEQKQQETDKLKIAKKTETAKLNQDPKTRTTSSDLDFS